MLPSLSQTMPTKQVTYRNDKAVVVRVYVEKPRKKRSASIQHHHHHHHHLHYHIHHTVAQEVVHGSTCKGFDRRARLLMYSHSLRESSREASSTPLLSKWCPNNNLQPLVSQIAPSTKKRPEYEGKVACLGSWKLLIPSFLRSWSKAQKKEKKKKQVHGGFLGNGMKLLQVRTGKSFIPNLFSKTRKSA